MSISKSFRQARDYISSEREELRDLESVLNLSSDEEKCIIHHHVVIPQGRFRLKKNMIVSRNGFLEIRPGAEVYLDNQKSILCLGPINAKGNSTDPIKISGYYDQMFGKLLIASQNNLSTLHHCDISKGSGISIEEMTRLAGIDPNLFKKQHLPYVGGPISIFYSSPNIESCFFHDMQCKVISPVFIVGNSSPSINNNRFENNSAGSGGVLWNESTGFPVIKEGYFFRNKSSEVGGAVFNFGYGIMEDCIFEDCKSNMGGALFIIPREDDYHQETTKNYPLYIIDSLVAFNRASIVAGGVVLKECDSSSRGGIIAYNGPMIPSFEEMTGMQLSPKKMHSIRYNEQQNGFFLLRAKIIGNESRKGAGIYCQDKKVVLINNNVIYNSAYAGDEGVQVLSGTFSRQGLVLQEGKCNLAGVDDELR